MEETTISKMKTQIEEIEKRIKAIAMQMTTTSQMTAIKYCLEEIKQLLLDMGTEYDTHLADYSEHKEAYNELLQKYNTLYDNFNTHTQSYDDSMAENLTVHSQIQKDIDDIIYSLKEVEAQADNLETRIMVLEDIGGGSGSQTPSQLQVETTNFVEYVEFTPCMNKTSEYISPIVFFSCETTQTVIIKLRIEGNLAGTRLKNYIELYINDEPKLVEITNPLTSGHYDYEFMITFIPTKKLNNLYIKTQFNSSFDITRWHLTLIGRNICIYNNEKDLKIICFDDKYFITYTTSLGYFLYGVQERGQISLNTNRLTQYNVTDLNIKYNLMTLMPALVNNSEPLAYDDNFLNNVMFVILDGTYTQYTQSLKLNDEYILELKSTWTVKPSAIDMIPNGIGNGSEAFILTSYGGDVYVIGRGSMNKQIKYDGVKLQDQWYGVATVKNNNAKIGDANTKYNGVVLRREDGMNIFFPEFDNTYFVEIGYGRNTSAYLQEDGSINVYINRLCNIYKYVLRKNLDGIFEVSNIVTCIKGITRYEELYDGQVLTYSNFYFTLTTEDALIKE